MRKHIKFRADLVAPQYKQVNVQILEQTHRVGDFATYGKYRASNGFTLYSSAGPQAVNNIYLYVCGSNRDYDNTVLTLSFETYKKFKFAVEAYNKEFEK